MAKYNQYGEFAARRRAKKKADEAEALLAKPESTKKPSEKKAPNIDWEPMAHKKIKLPKHPIDWEDISTQTHSDALINRLDNSEFQLLSMPTGTGKTAVTIAALGKLQARLGQTLPFVVLAPKKVVEGFGWHNTILSWNTAHPDNVLEPLFITTPDKFKATGTHPATLRLVMQKLGQHGLIVLDEVQKFKDPTGQRAKQLQKYAGFKKIGLSATPITNNVIFDSCSYLVMGGFYRNKSHFMAESGLLDWLDQWGVPQVYDASGAISRLKWPYYDTMLNQWSSVLYKPDIDITELDMPEVRKHIYQLPFNKQLTEDMRSLRHAYKNRMFDSFIDFFMEYVERLHTDQDRLGKLKEILEKPGVRQPIIFYRNESVKEAIIGLLEELNKGYQVVAGGYSFSNVDLESDDPILIQYQSGAEGIELKHSNTTIYYQNQTSYDILKQARGRNVRRGMGNQVDHYYIIADDLIDAELFDRVNQREEISESLLQEIVDNIVAGKETRD